jgi:hypothetical protein
MACGSAFVSAVALFGGEDLQIIALPLFVTDALSCLGGADPLSCVSGVITIVSSVVGALEAVVDQFQGTYAHAFDPPIIPAVIIPSLPAGDSSGGGEDDDPCPCFVLP